MEHLSILSAPAVSHVTFGIFNLAWPNIAFWIAVVVGFPVLAWLRIPQVMESDAASRRQGETK